MTPTEPSEPSTPCEVVESSPSGQTGGASFDEFYRREWRSLTALGWTLTGSWSAAEEVAQDALLDAYRRWDAVADLDKAGRDQPLAPGDVPSLRELREGRELLAFAYADSEFFQSEPGVYAVVGDGGYMALVGSDRVVSSTSSAWETACVATPALPASASTTSSPTRPIDPVRRSEGTVSYKIECVYDYVELPGGRG